MDLQPEPPPRVTAPLPPQSSLEEAVQARCRLADMVRKNDEVLLALQLRQQSDDRTIIKALAKVRDLFELLRQAGCTIVQATRAEELMELALEAPDVRPPKRSSARYYNGAAGVLVFIMLIFVAIMVLEITQAGQGWEIGTCSITLFTNQTCLQDWGCHVEVSVRSGTMFVSKNPWTLPIAHVGSRGEFTRYEGDPFRCCNDEQGQVGSCCGMVSGGVAQKTAETFCDAFGTIGLNDWQGRRCPTGSWPCLFTVNEEFQTVRELKYYSQPDVSVYIIAISFLALILLVCATVRLMHIFDIRCNCGALLQRSQEEEEADLYDPDDPATDWGQVVQEAAQEEAARHRQGRWRGWLKQKLEVLQEMWRRLTRCVRRGDSKANSEETPRGDSKSSRRSNTRVSQVRGSSKQSLPRSSSKLSLTRSSSKLSRGRSASKLRANSKGLDFEGELGKEEESQRKAAKDQKVAPEPSRAAASRSKGVQGIAEASSEEEEIQRVPTAAFPPGFVWHGDGKDPELADGSLEKYLRWESTGKELEEVAERDIYPGFQAGNLGGMARLAQQQRSSLLLPIVEPMSKHSAEKAAYPAGTLHYSCSTLRESRRKRKRGTMKKSARSLDPPQKWNWARQEEHSFHKHLPVENGPRFSTIKVPGSQPHVLSLE